MDSSFPELRFPQTWAPTRNVGNEVLCAVLFFVLMLAFCHEGQAQMAIAPYATQYFLDQPPSRADLATLPPNARDVIIAKVRLTQSVSYLGGRDQSGEPWPFAVPKDLFRAVVKIVDVLSGSTKNGDEFGVFFGIPGPGRKYKYPRTPRMNERAYFIVSYRDEDDVRRLVGFPTSRDDYERWKREWLDYEDMRGRPGARDK
jgi:hypothetical protein